MKRRQILALGISAVLLGSQPAMAEGAEPLAETTVTEAPATEAPATEAPVTEAPATEAPATEAPATEAPVTEAPATEAPVTEAPVTEAPVTEAPITEAPVTEAPATETLATEAPTTEMLSENGTDTEFMATESETTVLTEHEVETDWEETDTETEDWTEEATVEDLEGLIEEDTEESNTSLTNEELIARQNIVTPDPISLEFRFRQVKKVWAVVKNPQGAAVREKRSEDAVSVGELPYYGLCYILEDSGSEWIYVESGNVRGFILAKEVVTGETAQRLVRVKGEKNLPLARLTMARDDNSAYTYTHTTVYPVVVAGTCALAKDSVQILEARRDSARTVGTLEKGDVCYILADKEKEWVFVESGNVRGFVQSSSLETGKEADAAGKDAEVDSRILAEQELAPEENAACYYTLTSVKAASQAAITRSDMVNYSFQFLGNPYVWGGVSLTDGCDCSGFTQSIYAHFGYALPRIAEAQAVCSMQIPLDSAEPGDLIFYARDGYIYHVSMYIGDGQVIHAAGKSRGITITGIGSSAVWAVRIIQD